jgi:hypothetical protein
MRFFKSLNDRDFKEFMAFYTISLSFVYMFLITFTAIPKENQRFADIILGSLLTIVIGKVLREYFNKPNEKDKPTENEPTNPEDKP